MIIKKISSDKITEYHWDLSKPFISLSSFELKLESKIEPVFEVLSESERELEWDGNYDPLADTLEEDSKRRFINADRKYFEKLSRHIDVNEGTTNEGNALRSCRRQAQLWMSWKIFNMPNSAPANLPGCSDHNYGLAVDLKSVNNDLSKILFDFGWSDNVGGEKWHFSCTKSVKYTKVQRKISELRNGLAGNWALDSIKAFELTNRKNELSQELDSRYQVFRAQVESFNRQAKIFNDAKIKFISETNGFEIERDRLLIDFAEIDNLSLQFEEVYVEYRNAIDEIINILEADLEEIRRLMSLNFSQINRELLDDLGEIPEELESRYQELQRRFNELKNSLNLKMDNLEAQLVNFNSGNGVFERRAVELIKEYNFLIKLRQKLESKKKDIERGYVNLQLIGRESMFLFSRAGSVLERIQLEVDNT